MRRSTWQNSKSRMAVTRAPSMRTWDWSKSAWTSCWGRWDLGLHQTEQPQQLGRVLCQEREPQEGVFDVGRGRDAPPQFTERGRRAFAPRQRGQVDGGQRLVEQRQRSANGLRLALIGGVGMRPRQRPP